MIDYGNIKRHQYSAARVYTWDWTLDLDTGVTIQSFSFPGATTIFNVLSSSSNGSMVSACIQLIGATLATVGQQIAVPCTVVFSDGVSTDTRTIYLMVVSR